MIACPPVGWIVYVVLIGAVIAVVVGVVILLWAFTAMLREQRATRH